MQSFSVLLAIFVTCAMAHPTGTHREDLEKALQPLQEMFVSEVQALKEALGRLYNLLGKLQIVLRLRTWHLFHALFSLTETKMETNLDQLKRDFMPQLKMDLMYQLNG